jgi:NACHT domain-containing protein
VLLELATNIFANALWELALKPLYRATTGGLVASRAKRKLQQSIRRAARALVQGGAGPSSEIWADFLGTDEIQTLVVDLFLVHLTTKPMSDQYIRAAFATAWSEFAVARGAAPKTVDIGSVVSQVASGVEEIVADALEGQVLSVDPETAQRRREIVEDRTAVVQRLIAADPGSSVDYHRFEEQLRREVAARYGQIEPPNLLGRERIDIERLFVTPRLSYPSASDQDSAYFVAQTFDSFVETIDRCVVLGNPGAGKSTLVAKTCVDLANGYGKRRRRSLSLTPWCIELRRLATDFPGSGLPMALTDYFEYWARASYQLTVPKGAFDWLLCRGHLLVVFDGLDELIDTSKRKDVRDAVESFCRRYATTPVLITSRFVGYHQAPLDEAVFDTLQLQDFDGPRVARYSNQWFDIRLPDEPPEVRKQSAKQFLRDSATTGGLRNNPLMLALLASLYRGPGSIPRNLPDVYDSCASLLFSTWDKLRGIEVVLPFAEHVRPALRELAWWVFTTPALAEGITRPQAVTKTAEYLEKRRFGNPDKARASAEDFIDFCRGRAWVFTDQGLTAAGEDLFGFTHRTFLEFFAAEYLAFRKQSVEELVAELVPKIVAEQWDVVALIALQIKARSYPDGADDIVLALLRSLRPYRGYKLSAGIAFLLRLLHGVVPSPPTTRKLGVQAMLYAARGFRQHTDERVSVFDAIAGVGDEVRSEVVAGVISAERKLICEKSAYHAQLGTELALHADKLGSERTRRFWSIISRHTVKHCSDDLKNAALKHADVALSLWPETASAKDIAEMHGLDVVFRPVERILFASDDAPIRRILSTIASGDANTLDKAWTELSDLGMVFGERPMPWIINAKSAEIALCSNEIMALARRSRGLPKHVSGTARAAIWTVSACTFEALARLRRNSTRDTENFELYVQNLSLSKDLFLAAVAVTLTARRDGSASTRDGSASTVDVSAELSLADDWAGVVGKWSSGESSALTFT